MNTKELGELGERIACEYLVKKGYKILGKNYKIISGRKKIFGEIDIIVRKKWNLFYLFHNSFPLNNSSELFSGLLNKEAIHFVEVKTIIGNPSASSGQANNFYPEEKVDYRKRNKLRKLCLIWLEKNKFPQNYPYQIDVIGILINENTRNANIHYFQNVVEDKN